MLRWVITFFVIAIIAGLLGFTNMAGDLAYIAKILFFIFFNVIKSSTPPTTIIVTFLIISILMVIIHIFNMIVTSKMVMTVPTRKKRTLGRHHQLHH